MTADRTIVVNADDFGRTDGINEGILHAHEHGIVTSATMMVRWPAAEAAAGHARANPDLSVGLHLDLAEWEFAEGEWRAVYEVIDSDDPAAVDAEVDAQLARFERLVGRAPTHLDSHQHVHRSDPVRTALARAGDRLGVPVRDVTEGVTYRGDFYGQDGKGYPCPDAITVDHLVSLLHDLPAGISELGCHPGFAEDLDNVYRDERRLEVETLCDPRVRSVIDDLGIRLCSFRAVGEILFSRMTDRKGTQ